MHGSMNIKFVKQSLYKPGQALRVHEAEAPRFGRQVALDIYLFTAIGLTPGGSSTAHIYTQAICRTIQLTTLVGRLPGIRTQSGQTKINNELTA